MDPCEWHTGSLGSIPGCADIKLVDYEEAGYLTSSKPPEGEIWIRGGCVAEGYWRNDAETEKAFTGDGWFKTGDIGRINDTGTVMIIDRKKNLIKTLNGEYIAIEKVCHRKGAQTGLAETE
jgi:long-chain acyl-CoA synthetase